MYNVKVMKKARKDLDALGDKLYAKVEGIIFDLAKNPRIRGSIKLTNREEYRIRIGNFRILYEIDDNDKKVWVVRVKHRKEVYR